MTNRIWEELCETVFQNYYLIEFVDRQKRILNFLEVGALIFSIVGIIGWYKFPQNYLLWSVLLITIQLVIFYRSKFLTNQGEIAILEIVGNFYQEQKIELERLWQDLYSENINEKQAEKRFRAIQEKEAYMIKTHNFKRVKNIDKLNTIASNKKDNYLKRFNK